ncbi:helix-turn-helix transcriptional regulator [Candidatus Microgenomates bacterium]|nr:helix-turn-helix transcriptional regulator [Candidatus Microgenomates bacterium]
MTTEAPRSPNGQDHVQEARMAFNKELLGREYQANLLVTKVLQLQNVLVVSDLSPEKIYHELSIVAGQAVERAAIFEDPATSSIFLELQKGFQLAYETFKPRIEAVVALPQPTKTENLPAMTSAKGGSNRRKTSATNSAPATAEAQTIEETFGSFLRQKRNEAKLSQAKLATSIGFANNVFISGLENNHQLSFDEEKAAQIASALSLSPEDTEKYMELYHKQFPTPPETSK